MEAVAHVAPWHASGRWHTSTEQDTVAGPRRRLPFYLHCLVHAVVTAAFLRSVPTMCSWSFFRGERGAAFFGQAASALGKVASLFMAAGGGEPPDPAALKGEAGTRQGLPNQCHCQMVLATLRVLLAFVLPTFAVALQERLERRAFVLARLREGGGWSRQDMAAHLLWDWMGAAVLSICLLPVVVCLVWQGSVIVALSLGNC